MMEKFEEFQRDFCTMKLSEYDPAVLRTWIGSWNYYITFGGDRPPKPPKVS
jgi:hypothetical protein